MVKKSWLQRKSPTQAALLKVLFDPYKHLYEKETGQGMTDEQVKDFFDGMNGSYTLYRINDGQGYFYDYPGIEQYRTHGDFVAALFDEAADLAEA